VARLKNGGKMSFSESFHPFLAEPHTFYIFTANTPIFYLSCNKICPKKMLFNLKIKKDNRNPIDTSIIVPVRGVA
jgi:hypothetical protein